MLIKVDRCKILEHARKDVLVVEFIQLFLFRMRIHILEYCGWRWQGFHSEMVNVEIHYVNEAAAVPPGRSR